VPVRASDVGHYLGGATSRQGSAEIWYAWVGDHVADIERFSKDLLSHDEQAHLAGYRIREAAERYVVTRSLVRAVLSEHLAISARSIQVSRTEAGKPVITQGIHFNVSHSGDLILLAVSEERPVGVDIERKREVQRVDALLRRWLTADEQTSYASLQRDGASASEAFLRLWSLKEARLKALGVGISGASRARLDIVDAFSLDNELAQLAAQRPDPGYVGAIAFA
jgi:4'-phosphopantetheinyl transferase